MAALVFVDESGANTKMTRLRGRALGGQRLLARIPHGHYQTSTLISGLRLAGPCAPWLFGGSMNGEMFLAWVRQGLAPTLRPGDVVILDNLATHKIRGVHQALEAVGARLLYLPPYSPDFNPIEPMWSKGQTNPAQPQSARGGATAVGRPNRLSVPFDRRLQRLLL